MAFSNGDPLDAEAVKFSQDRYAAAPTSPEGPLWVRNVAGAWEERTQITLEANPNYWNGAPHLDSVRFVYFTDPQIAVDALRSKDVDAALARDSNHLGPLIEDGFSGYRSLVTGGSLGMINAQEGRPGADPRVRRAIQLATDADALQKTVVGEYGHGETTLFPEHSRWATEAQGLEYDPEEARRLLEEAKADGYDGKLQILGGPSASLRTRNLAFKAQMEAVGFEVESDTAASITDQITRIAGSQDYDITSWSYNFREADPLAKMFAVLHSDGIQRYGAYSSPELDSLIEGFEAATTEEEQHRIMEALQEQINEDVPFLLWGWSEEISFWNDNVHGIVGAANTMVMFDRAWID